MSKEFELFDKAFPFSSYREINKRYEGLTDTEEGHKKYQDSKRPINTAILTYEQIKDTKNRVGWIVPKEYIVIDIDNMLNASNVYTILEKKGFKFAFMKGRHGGHFIFKNNKDIGNGANYVTSIGVGVDTRSMEKGYIILPENDNDRSWNIITSEVDTIPFFLTPLKSLKVYTDFSILKDGDGRNSKLFEHFMNLKDFAIELTIAEKVESIKIINDFILKEPMSADELRKTILRDSVINKEDKSILGESGDVTLERIATKIIEDFKLISSNEEVYAFNGKYYQTMSETALERIIHLNYQKNLLERNRKEIIKLIKLKSWVEPNQLNLNWNEIVLKNGILNISEMKLYPHSPLSYNTIYVDHNFNPEVKKSGVIEAFFETLAHENDAKKMLLFEVVGYCFIRKNIFEKFFICYGEGSTGKSTYLNLMANLLGKQNVTNLSLIDLKEKYHPAELFGKLVNIGDDISAKMIEDGDILKKLISGQEVMIQQKYKRPISFANFAKLIYTANKIPWFEDRSSGMLRRMTIIEINRKIANPDPFFLQKITEEDYEYLMYVALKAIYGVLKRNGFTYVESVNQSLKLLKQSQSSVLSFLLEYNFDTESLNGKGVSLIYAQYTDYCEKSGYKRVNVQNFKKEVCDETALMIFNTTNGPDTPQQMRFKK